MLLAASLQMAILCAVSARKTITPRTIDHPFAEQLLLISQRALHHLPVHLPLEYLPFIIRPLMNHPPEWLQLETKKIDKLAARAVFA